MSPASRSFLLSTFYLFMNLIVLFGTCTCTFMYGPSDDRKWETPFVGLCEAVNQTLLLQLTFNLRPSRSKSLSFLPTTAHLWPLSLPVKLLLCLCDHRGLVFHCQLKEKLYKRTLTFMLTFTHLNLILLQIWKTCRWSQRGHAQEVQSARQTLASVVFSESPHRTTSCSATSRMLAIAVFQFVTGA